MASPTRNTPFRRFTGMAPVIIPATDQASQVTIPTMDTSITTVVVQNPFPVHIGFVGTPIGAGQDNDATDKNGYLIPPGFFGIISTQMPAKVSCIAVDMPNFPVKDGSGNLIYPNAYLRLTYGSGE